MTMHLAGRRAEEGQRLCHGCQDTTYERVDPRGGNIVNSAATYRMLYVGDVCITGPVQKTA
jgi:hypothetical protein